MILHVWKGYNLVKTAIKLAFTTVLRGLKPGALPSNHGVSGFCPDNIISKD